MKRILLGIMVLAMISPAVQADLAMLLQFDEGSGLTATDASTFGNDGTLHSGFGLVDDPASVPPEWTADRFGRPGKALLFGGTPVSVKENHVQVQYNSVLDITSNWTMALWYRQDDNTNNNNDGTWGRLISTDHYEIESGGTDGNKWFWQWDAGTDWQFVVTDALSITVWHHYAVTFDGVTFRAYIDGVEDVSARKTGLPPLLTKGWWWEPMRIGCQRWDNRQFIGAMDDVAIFNETLTSNEIKTVKGGDFSAWGAPSPFVALSPDPRDGASLIDPDLTQVGWELPPPRQIGDSISAEVYFDTVEQNVIDGDPCSLILSKTADATSATLPALTTGTEYFWRVDVYDPNTPNGPELKEEGTVWSFTTQPTTATALDPLDNGTDASIFGVLDWSLGYLATSHTVYGPSTDETAVTNGTASSVVVNEPESSYDPTGNLTLDTEYFWRVDEDNGSGNGAVWSFTTSGTYLLDDFGYGSNTEPNDLRAAWIGSPDPYLIKNDNGWMAMPYTVAAQTFTHTLDEAVDATSAAYLYVSTWQNESNLALPPDITIKLLDSADQVVISGTLTEFTFEIIETWRINMLSTGPGDVADVKKIVIEIPGQSNTAKLFEVDDIGISVPACLTPPALDSDGDCRVTLVDVAAFAVDWQDCGLFPAGSCP